MLNNTPINKLNESTKRNIIFAIIGIICVISIILAVVFSASQEESPQPPTKEVEVEKKEIIDFSSVFDNKLNKQQYLVKSIEKLDDNKDIVYSKYDLKERSDGRFEIDLKIPAINIDDSAITTINEEIDELFRGKAREAIINEEDYEIIYTVEYTAYINSNILSLVIKSTLKEGSNAQRVIVKAYNYNIDTKQLVNIDEILSIKQLNKTAVQKEIKTVVERNAQETQNLIDLGYKAYERNLSDEIYKVENVDNFFYGPDGVLYIIYAYGNNSYTTELDIITLG